MSCRPSANAHRSRPHHRAAWVDDTTGDVLDYCGSRCAGQVGMPHLMGSGECSLPGCVNVNMVHPRSKEEMGYCCENHRLRATQRSLVGIFVQYHEARHSSDKLSRTSTTHWRKSRKLVVRTGRCPQAGTGETEGNFSTRGRRTAPGSSVEPATKACGPPTYHAAVVLVCGAFQMS